MTTGRPRNPERVTRDCQHKRAHHEHGTMLGYVNDQCRCRPCTDANSAYVVGRRKQIAYGRWAKHLTDAAPVLAHVQLLRSAGMGVRTIAARSGASIGAIEGLMYGENGSPPSARVTATTANRILALRPDLGLLADGAMIDATGTRRRLQALAYQGWTHSRLARELHCSPQHVSHLLHSPGKTTAANARRIRDLYDRLWDVAPTPANHHQRAGMRRAQDSARSHGWAPPMAWDDDTIDNPDATPELGDADAYATRKTVHIDDLEHLLTFEPLATAQRLADRLHVTRDAVQTACRRAGRQDLLDLLNRNADLAGHNTNRKDTAA